MMRLLHLRSEDARACSADEGVRYRVMCAVRGCRGARGVSVEAADGTSRRAHSRSAPVAARPAAPAHPRAAAYAPRTTPVYRENSVVVHVSRSSVIRIQCFVCRCAVATAETMPTEEEPGAAMDGCEHGDGSPQQFCLRWNNYQSNLANCFVQLLQTESFVDVTLACDGQSLKAHKVVLSACSPYFQTLFMDNPCRHPIIIMRDIKYCDLRAVVDFMYRGEINVSQDQITALLKVAETLKIRGLTDVSGEHAVLPTPRANKRAMSCDRESVSKSRRRAGGSSERSPGESPRREPGTPPDALAPLEPPPPHLAPPPPPTLADDVDIRPGIAEMIREEERVSTYCIIHLAIGQLPRLRRAAPGRLKARRKGDSASVSLPVFSSRMWCNVLFGLRTRCAVRSRGTRAFFGAAVPP